MFKEKKYEKQEYKNIYEEKIDEMKKDMKEKKNRLKIVGMEGGKNQGIEIWVLKEWNESESQKKKIKKEMKESI